MNTIPFTWQEFDLAAKTLAGKLSEHTNEFNYVYGIPRGGIVLAVKLCHLLEKGFTAKLRSDALVVDDISDTGHTLSNPAYDGLSTATIHIARGTQFIPDYWICIKPANSWIVYPWEKR